MKIIFITREGYNLPGARVRCYNFARELQKYGIQTEVLSFSDSLGAKDGEEESQMSLRDKVKFNGRAFRALKKYKKSIFYIQRFNYHSFAPYLVHIFDKNKIIFDMDDWEMREDPKYYFGFYPSSKAHFFTKQIAKSSVFCIAASLFLKDFLMRYNKNTYYIPSGVDTELFKPSLNGLGQKVIFSWIGTFHRMEYIDNIKFALDCFSKLRRKYDHIYFDIVGDGIYRDRVIEIIEEFKDLNIEFKGWLVPDKISEYLAAIHIGLMPAVSKTKFNLAKSPTKLFEYMAMAKPTVSSNIGEAAYIIQDGANGLLAKDKEEFVEKMQRLINDSALREQMGNEARKTIENNYSLNLLGKQLYEILKAVY